MEVVSVRNAASQMYRPVLVVPTNWFKDNSWHYGSVLRDIKTKGIKDKFMLFGKWYICGRPRQ